MVDSLFVRSRSDCSRNERRVPRRVMTPIHGSDFIIGDAGEISRLYQVSIPARRPWNQHAAAGQHISREPDDRIDTAAVTFHLMRDKVFLLSKPRLR